MTIDNFFNFRIRAFDPDRDGDYLEHSIFRLHEGDKTSCSPMTKMEYDYFYYLYSNYYKKGAPESWALIEPHLSSNWFYYLFLFMLNIFWKYL